MRSLGRWLDLSTTTTAAGDGFFLPDIRMEMPQLLVPGKMPTGRVKIDDAHPFCKYLGPERGHVFGPFAGHNQVMTVNGGVPTPTVNNDVFPPKADVNGLGYLSSSFGKGDDLAIIYDDVPFSYLDGSPSVTILAVVTYRGVSFGQNSEIFRFTDNTQRGLSFAVHATSDLRAIYSTNLTVAGWTTANDTALSAYINSGDYVVLGMRIYPDGSDLRCESLVGSIGTPNVSVIKSVAYPGSAIEIQNLSSAELHIAGGNNSDSGAARFPIHQVFLTAESMEMDDIESFCADPYQFLIPA